MLNRKKNEEGMDSLVERFVLEAIYDASELNSVCTFFIGVYLVLTVGQVDGNYLLTNIKSKIV